MLPDVTGALRALVRFVLIRSGESIESVLEGNFREILHAVVAERMEASSLPLKTTDRNTSTGFRPNFLALFATASKALSNAYSLKSTGSSSHPTFVTSRRHSHESKSVSETPF